MILGKRGGLRHGREHAITGFHISAAETLAPMELLAARHERYSLLRYAGKSKYHARRLFCLGVCKGKENEVS